MAKLVEKYTLRSKERTFLPDAVPLPVPFVLYIDPVNRCNFRCRFCPTGNRGLLREVNRAGVQMTLAQFRKLIGDLKEFPGKIKVINLWKDGESLLNPDFPLMCEELAAAGVAERIILRTNGSLLTPELNRRLAGSGLYEIGISIEAVSTEKYRELVGVGLDYEKLKALVADLYQVRGKCRIYTKIVDVGLSDAEKQKFQDDFGEICDYCAIENLMGWSNSGVGDFKLNTDSGLTIDGMRLQPKEVCSLPFTCLAVNSNGSVSVCCVDWGHWTIVGDIGQEKLRDIWNGEKLRNFRLLHLKHRRAENPACADCDFIASSVDNLDGYEQQLIERITGAGELNL